MRKRQPSANLKVLVVALSAGLTILSGSGVFNSDVGAQDGESPAFTSEFPLGDCKFRTKGANRYFILAPGRQLFFDNRNCEDCEELVENRITVLDETRAIQLEIDGRLKTVKTRVVEEFETVDGELAEISRNFFAECEDTRDVYYFGEDVDIFEDGEVVSHDGAWLAGKNGARPGIIMPGGAFLLGSRYFQEIAPDVALDRAEHVAMGLEIEVPAGDFENCVEVEETTPLDPEELSTKIYCPETGLVIDDDLELVKIIKGNDDHDERMNRPHFQHHAKKSQFTRTGSMVRSLLDSL
ncbi:MAG: hypothetical protein JSW39_20870 [Desulfobacterales bacterium]|nr:MAG: hypothetical protein JSW39_20870 [Desulfobacterales bacterium]